MVWMPGAKIKIPGKIHSKPITRTAKVCISPDMLIYCFHQTEISTSEDTKPLLGSESPSSLCSGQTERGMGFSLLMAIIHFYFITLWDYEIPLHAEVIAILS
jgi:hypothetical protein